MYQPRLAYRAYIQHAAPSSATATLGPSASPSVPDAAAPRPPRLLCHYHCCTVQIPITACRSRSGSPTIQIAVSALSLLLHSGHLQHLPNIDAIIFHLPTLFTTHADLVPFACLQIGSIDLKNKALTLSYSSLLLIHADLVPPLAPLLYVRLLI